MKISEDKKAAILSPSDVTTSTETGSAENGYQTVQISKTVASRIFTCLDTMTRTKNIWKIVNDNNIFLAVCNNNGP